MPHSRPDSVGADQGQRQILPSRGAGALEHGQSLGVACDILKLAAEPQFDVMMLSDLRKQRCLQLAAMDDQIRRASARSRGVAEWQAGDFAAATHAHQADGLGRDGDPGRSRLQSERDQNAAGIGRELHAGARFPQAARPSPGLRLGSLSPRAPARPSIPRFRRRRRRWCARPPPKLGQAALSFTTHSGGRASPGFRSAAKRNSVEQ